MFAPYVESGQLRLLAAYHNGRFKTFPDVPSVKEMGYPVSAESGQTICGPAGLPASIRTKLQESFREAMKDKDFIAIMEKTLQIVEYVPGAEIEVWIRNKYQEVGRTVKEILKK